MTKHNLSALCAAFALAILSACTNSTVADPTADVLPGVPRSTRISQLTLAQYTEVCEWRFEYMGEGADSPFEAPTERVESPR